MTNTALNDKDSPLCMPELQKNTSKKLEKVTKIYLFI